MCLSTGIASSLYIYIYIYICYNTKSHLFYIHFHSPFIFNQHPQKKMNRPGDWNCRSCSHLNFQRRDSCQRCREPRLGGISTDLFSGFGSRSVSNSFGFNTGPDVRPGDWYCSLGNCGTHNFANRSTCFKCGAPKNEFSSSTAAAATGFIDMNVGPRRGRFGFGSSSGGGGTSGRSSWKSGDWICPRSGCNEHNFASRSECFRCNAPKEPATEPPY